MKHALHALVPLLTLSFAPIAFSASPSPGHQAMLMTNARATGMAHQFSARCGTDEKLLKAYKAKYERETKRESERLYRDLDIDAEFQIGFDEANRYYDSVNEPQFKVLLCQQMKEKIVLSLGSTDQE
ncbi:MAG: hypothetical protein ACOY3E_01820 [Pseudomonadota bacterium]